MTSTPPKKGIVRAPRRPAGWIPPGPPPAGARGRPDLEPGPGEDLCLLSGDWRIFQRLDGHRWSADDLVTACVASRAVAAPARLLDLGCGIGSVLLMLAWRFPGARLVGIEAQAASLAMARRSAAWNGADDRCELRAGDLRDPALLPEGPVFDLVTGTPPYFIRGEGVESPGAQRAQARFEHRGGVEDYCLAAARALAPAGRFVLCAGALERDRVVAGSAAAGLAIEAWTEVVPRADKPPLFDVTTMRRDAAATPPAAPVRLTIRDRDGRWTPEFAAVRTAMGMPATPPR